MGNIILVCVIAFLAVMTFAGYKRGLLKTVFSLLSIVIVLATVTVLTPIAREIIRETIVYSYIQEKAEMYIDTNLDKYAEENVIAGLGVNEQEKVINGLPLPQSIKDSLINNNTENEYTELEVSNFREYLIQYIADKVTDTIAFIILFIIVTVAIKTAVILLDIISKLPVINFFNKGGGALFGFSEAMMIVWIICVITTAFSATEWGQKLFVEINNNVILSLIYNNNILEKVIFGFFNS